MCLPVTVLAQSAADSASLRQFYGEWMGAAMRGFAAYASYYAADGSILPPNAAPVTGREAIARWMENASATAPYLTSPKGARVDEIRFLGGGLVVYRATLNGVRVLKDGTARMDFETKYFDVVRRKPDGGWEVLYRMWSDNNPIAGASAPAAQAPPENTYFEFQVERSARPEPGTAAPTYPPSLRQSRVAGEVLAQFVVDATGRADLRSFKVLRATNAEFETAVRQYVSQARFIPAEINGRRVRQLVQMPFSFSPPP